MAARLLNIDAGGRQHIDRYELIGEIASGGMATVYLARLTGVGGFQRFVAIKRLHPHLQGESEFVEMFLDEARLAAGIHHPNVVPILEVGASANGYYIVMEYIEGETLARLLARAASRSVRIPTGITVRISLDFLGGLHGAHELHDENGDLAGLVHRDVSPQNVLVGADGVARITDFGVARAASRLTATRVGQLKGKIAYMAPEQAAGIEDLDRRADVFACGIVIWETLAQKRLFKAENEAATLARVMSEPVPVLHRLAPQVPRGISDVVMKALEREPDARWSTCSEMADALEDAAAQTNDVAAPRDLQAYIAQVMGAEIQQHREAVRAWIAKSDSARHSSVGLLGPGTSVSAATMAVPLGDASASLSMLTAQPPSGSKLGRVIGLLALVLLGVGGFVAYKTFGVATDRVDRPPSVQAAQQDAAPPAASDNDVSPDDGTGSPNAEPPNGTADEDSGEKSGTDEPQAPPEGASAAVEQDPPRAQAPAPQRRTERPPATPAPTPTPTPKSRFDIGDNPYR